MHHFLKHNVAPACLAALLLFMGSPLTHAYSDASADHWAAETIVKAEEYGLMEGYPDGRFGVGDNMTRAEFATVLCRMFGWELPEVPTDRWIDCGGHWALPYLTTARDHDAIDGSGAFRPDDYISRSEMAVMLVRGLGYGSLAKSLESTDLPFPDVTENRGYIAIAYHLDIINGVEEKDQLKFLPTFSATREQAAAMLVRCYERYSAQTQWRHGFYAFNSFDQLSFADPLDGVSVGWARLEVNDGLPILNETRENGNDWVKPQGADLVTNYLSQRDITCNLSVFGSASAFAALVTPEQKAEAIALLTEAAAPYAGLTIDFEGLREEHREGFSSFMTDLRAALPAHKTLFVCVQPDTWFKGFDYRALGEVCDRVILMAHDYQWASIPDYYLGTGNTNCPVTPFDKIYTALQHITDPETGVADRSKIALAISFNTTGFHVDENGLLVDATFYHPSTATIAKRLGQSDSVRVWDETARNPYLEYTTEDGERYKLWYEDAQSITEKLQLARMFGVTGFSIWRLGMIPDDPALPHYNVQDVFADF